MSDGLAGPDFIPRGEAGDLEATRTVTGAQPRPGGAPARSEAERSEAVRSEAVLRPDPPADGTVTEAVTPRTATQVVRHGPGVTVTAGQAAVTMAQDTVTTGQDTVTTGPATPVSRQAGTGAWPAGIVRHGPGVPGGARPGAGHRSLTAAHVWTQSRLPQREASSRAAPACAGCSAWRLPRSCSPPAGSCCTSGCITRRFT